MPKLAKPKMVQKVTICKSTLGSKERDSLPARITEGKKSSARADRCERLAKILVRITGL